MGQIHIWIAMPFSMQVKGQIHRVGELQSRPA
jgi:hypothetical protein